MNLASKTDLELVALAISGDEQAPFSQLVVRYQSMIRQFLRRLTAGDQAQADDLAQETFLMAYQKLHTFKATGSFKSWLHTIAYRLFLRHIQKHPLLQLDENQAILVNNPQSEIEADLLAEKLMQVLSADERVVMTLFMSAAMSHSEIVAVTQIPLGTVKSHIQRAKVKLHKLLDRSQLVA
ncbi:RNA polymerase sigma factor [Kangiella sp. TOML190]|uniref:RNA polymerase sigma factor n=1 Tax=Kangiella sp. TOML190 TaxID=2931351 RepID=UPI00203B4FFB|nr:sigma-70 family RNA polymerase sigma factor [Kangiella sp. TOML190]